ncbi:hypothetical protein J6590_031228 [Homalodisca vitripennis]|nr:hypothetical protein J6590_031228 [Homalodisca vitripennis]
MLLITMVQFVAATISPCGRLGANYGRFGVKHIVPSSRHLSGHLWLWHRQGPETLQIHLNTPKQGGSCLARCSEELERRPHICICMSGELSGHGILGYLSCDQDLPVTHGADKSHMVVVCRSDLYT